MAARPPRLRPTIARIIKPQSSSSIKIERQERHWYARGRPALFATPGGYTDEHELNELASELVGASPDRAENLLVTAVRGVASRHSGSIGPHCMSILLSNGVPQIRVRFIPDSPHTAVFEGQNSTQEMPVAYCPWIIYPRFFRAPSI